MYLTIACGARTLQRADVDCMYATSADIKPLLLFSLSGVTWSSHTITIFPTQSLHRRLPVCSKDLYKLVLHRDRDMRAVFTALQLWSVGRSAEVVSTDPRCFHDLVSVPLSLQVRLVCARRHLLHIPYGCTVCGYCRRFAVSLYDSVLFLRVCFDVYTHKSVVWMCVSTARGPVSVQTG